jgi:hypothetical protein
MEDTMTARVSIPGLLLRTLPGVLLVVLMATPVVGARRDPRGPIYRSPEAVRSAQEILVDMEYLRPGGFQSGRVDEETAAALRSFQRDHFIRPTGVLDFETMGMLTSHGLQHPVARGVPAPAVETTPGTGPVAQAPSPAGEPVRVAQAGPEPAPAYYEEPAGREMPETASPIPAIAAVGVLLLAGGAALLRGRRR